MNPWPISEAQAVREAASRLRAGHIPTEVVEVLEVRGSVPREVGTRMLVTATETVGTIGGGHLELQAIACARERLAHGEHGPIEKRYPLGPALGQCCGGTVTLRHASLAAQEEADWEDPAPRFHLQLYGAGHVGRAIARLLAALPCQVQWIDEREDSFPTALTLPDHIQRVCVDAVASEVASAPPGARFLVLTHSHALDLEIVQAVLRRGDYAFLGLIGSRTKRARFESQLRARGYTDDKLARLICPIGIPGLEGKEPEVVAISAVAQLLQQASLPPATGNVAGGKVEK